MTHRVPQLDALRFTAVTLVLFRHYVIPPYDAGALSHVSTMLFRLGWTGVDLFFVLSGFLIGGLLFKEIHETGTLRVRRFLIRRAFKIWPAYYAFLLTYLFYFSEESVKATLVPLLPSFMHLQNFHSLPVIHLWTLAVEEHFYLLLPLALSRLPRQRTFLIGTFAILALCLTARLLFSHEPFNDVRHYYPTYLRIDSLMFGVLLAWIARFKPQTFARLARYKLLLFIIGLALISPMAFMELTEHRFVYTWGFTFLYLGYGSILIAALHTEWFDSPILTFIGRHSYSIYLWHAFAVVAPLRRAVNNGWLDGLSAESRWLVSTIVSILLSFAVGVVMSRIIEMPMLRLRDRLFGVEIIARVRGRQIGV